MHRDSNISQHPGNVVLLFLLLLLGVVDGHVDSGVLACDLLLFLFLDFLSEFCEQVVDVFLLFVVVNQIFDLVIDFLLVHFGLFAVEDDVLEFVGVFFLVFDVPMRLLDHVDRLHIH